MTSILYDSNFRNPLLYVPCILNTSWLHVCVAFETCNVDASISKKYFHNDS